MRNAYKPPGSASRTSHIGSRETHMSVPVRRRTAAVTGGVAAALLLAACGSSSGDSSSPSPTDPACQTYITAYGWHPGTSVSVFTSIKPPEQQQYEKSWADFSKCTGITIKY
jgi:alpha-glucoside transport system substrate-binding protein